MNKVNVKQYNNVPVKLADIHILWLLLQTSEFIHEDRINQLADKILNHTDGVYVERILNLGESLGLINRTRTGWKCNKFGIEFARSAHWRMWFPPSPIRKKFEDLGVGQALIGKRSRPLIIDLFSGVGGLGLGFEMAGFSVKVAVDNDPQACNAHSINFPNCYIVSEDIVKIAADPIRELCENFNISKGDISGVIGGPPCQGFSYMGERSRNDERNLLTSRFMDIVLQIEPDFFVMENVEGILTSGIPIEFYKHIIRMAKSIGEPANKLIDSLPVPQKTLAKRGRQFIKRQISERIDCLREWADSSVETGKNKFDIHTFLTGATFFFRVKLEELCRSTYSNAEQKQALEIVKESLEPERIVIGMFVEVALAKNILVPDDCIRLTELIAQGPNESRFCQIISDLQDDYNSIPQGGYYRGVRVGPVLLHLIERASQNYDVAPPTVLNAVHFGTPQERKRTFLVGIHKRLRKNFEFPAGEFVSPKSSDERLFNKFKIAPSAQDAISDLPDVDTIEELLQTDSIPTSRLTDSPSEYAAKMRLEKIDPEDFSLPRPSWNPLFIDCCKRTVHDQHARKRMSETPEGKQENISGRKRLHRNLPSHTIRAGTREGKGSHTAVRPIHYDSNRVITVREAARLMGYPDWMTFHPTKWHGFRLVGNGVPAPLGHALAAAILQNLYKKQN